MTKQIVQELVDDTKKWLRPEGITHFKEIKETHGEVAAVFNDGGIPHPVHFREGMQVRNFMRSTVYCTDWTDIDFDDNWVELIERSIK